MKKNEFVTLMLIFLMSLNWLFFIPIHDLNTAWHMMEIERDTGTHYCDMSITGDQC